jgi:hypothetical protein
MTDVRHMIKARGFQLTPSELRQVAPFRRKHHFMHRPLITLDYPRVQASYPSGFLIELFGEDDQKDRTISYSCGECRERIELQDPDIQHNFRLLVGKMQRDKYPQALTDQDIYRESLFISDNNMVVFADGDVWLFAEISPKRRIRNAVNH